MTTKIIFLHTPKTAGQSVHAHLMHAFKKEDICPARTNEQLKLMTIDEINQYKVFSGHMDWALLDCIRGQKYFFTILRDPLERILSYYFYMRKEAMALSQSELGLKENLGKAAILKMSAHDYFTGGPPYIRNFLDGLYDNFYTYYFAGRTYRARQDFMSKLIDNTITEDNIIEMAISNLKNLDQIFLMNEMRNLISKIYTFSSQGVPIDGEYRVNINNEIEVSKRFSMLNECGANSDTFERLNQMCRMDNIIWNTFSRADYEGLNP